MQTAKKLDRLSFRILWKLILNIQSILPGYLLPGDIKVRVKDKQNSIFYIQKKSDEIFTVMPHYERYTWKIVKSIVKPGDVCIDVGAHIGTYTIPLARIVGQKGLVIAIEPSPIAQILSINVRLNRLQNVVIITKAAHSKKKKINFYFTPLVSEVSSLHKGWIKGIMKIYKRKVDAEPLDELLSELRYSFHRIKLLKIDVEGNEIEVLRGARNTLKITEYVIFEATKRSIKECIKILRSASFKNFKFIESSGPETYNFMASR